MIVTNPKTGQTIDSPHTTPEAVAQLANQQTEFAQSLRSQAINKERPLSEAQVFWIHKLAMPPESLELESTKIPKLLDKVKRLMWKLDEHARIKLYQDKADETQVKVFHSGGDSTQYMGHIKGRHFYFRDNCPEIVKAQLLVFSKHPIKFMQAYGKEWGRCMVCGRELENEESVALGIGPICLGRLG